MKDPEPIPSTTATTNPVAVYFTEDGEVPTLTGAQMRHIKQQGRRNPFYERMQASRAAGYLVINGECVPYDEWERRAAVVYPTPDNQDDAADGSAPTDPGSHL